MDYTAILAEQPQRCFDARSHFLRDRLVWQLLRYGQFLSHDPLLPRHRSELRSVPPGSFGNRLLHSHPCGLPLFRRQALKYSLRAVILPAENTRRWNVSQIHWISLGIFLLIQKSSISEMKRQWKAAKSGQ